MTLLGIFGALLGLLALPLAIVARTRLRMSVFFVAYVLHVGCAIVYHQYALNNVTDASLYYFDPYKTFEFGFSTGTTALVFFTQTIKSVLGGTYLDYFLLFQAIGFFGIALLMRMIEEIYVSLQVSQPGWTYLILFLPGMNFWTSGLSKDAPVFTAACLALWGVMQPRRRFIAIAVAVLVMTLIRPHVGLIASVAVTWALLVDRATHPLLRLVLVLLSVGGLVFAALSLKETFNLDVTSAESVSNFVEWQEGFLESDAVGNTAVLDASYPVKLLSLLFRPFFLDANGLMALTASVENLCLVFIFGLLVLNGRTVWAAMKAEPFIRFALIFALGLTAALTYGYYNVGTGLRQKTMVIPAYILVFTAVVAVRRARRQAFQAMRLIGAPRVSPA